MAVEMHVFFRGKLPNKRELSRAMGDLGFPLSIAAGSLEKQRGFMPMKLRSDETGVEFDVFEGRVVVEEIGGKDVDPQFERSANFRWGGDEDEMLAGLREARSSDSLDFLWRDPVLSHLGERDLGNEVGVNILTRGSNSFRDEPMYLVSEFFLGHRPPVGPNLCGCLVSELLNIFEFVACLLDLRLRKKLGFS